MTPEELKIQSLRRDLLFVLAHPEQRCKVCAHRDEDCRVCRPAWIGERKEARNG